MDFNQASKEFQALTHTYRSGQIDLETYRDRLKQLKITDEHGRQWMMQELTGEWHVRHNGQWVPARPPGLTPAVRGRPVKKRSGKIWAALAGLGGLGVVGVCVLSLLAVGFLLWFNPEIISWVAQEADSLFGSIVVEPSDSSSMISETKQIISTLNIPADSSRYTDEHGVSLTVPGEALEGGSEQIVMNAYTMDEEIGGQLSTVFNFESLLYEVGVGGEMDGAGKAELEFPFAGSNPVLMVVIDDLYYGFFEQSPENGVVRVHAHLGNMESGETTRAYYGDMPEADQSIRYALLSPKAGAGITDPDYHLAYMPGALQSEKLHTLGPQSMNLFGQARDPQDCSYRITGAGPTIPMGCRTNPEKSVIVKWISGPYQHMGTNRGVEFSQQEADNLVRAAQAIIDRYYQAGFTNAKVQTRWFGYALNIVVKPTGDPTYRFKSGTLELPVSVARGISAESPPLDLMHELAHWIQDQKYSFYRAGVSGSRRWWLETSAEVMVFMIDPRNIDNNLNTYRQMEGFQKAPLTWGLLGAQDEYIHAHLLWVSICSNLSACPLDQEQFKQAINTGAYPFDNPVRVNLLTHNLDDYALYLLNHPPRTTNTSAVTGVRMGLDGTSRVGELVNVGSGGDAGFQLSSHGNEGNFSGGNNGPANTPSKKIDAQIQKGGVYPLTIAGGDFGRSSLPAALIIQPGPPFWLKIGEAEPVRFDGSQVYTIQPISQALGEEAVRIIALGAGDSNRFQAEVTLLDLQGDWVMSDVSLVSMDNSCEEMFQDLGAQESGGDPADFVENLTKYFASEGTYNYQVGGGKISLVYEAGDGYALEQVRDLNIGFGDQRLPYNIRKSGSVDITPDQIEWKISLSANLMANPSASSEVKTSGSSNFSIYSLMGLMLLMLTGSIYLTLSSHKPGKKILGLILFFAVISLGCIAGRYTISSSAELTQIEYLLPADLTPEVDMEPIYRLTGTPVTTTMNVVFLIPQEEDEVQELPCQIQIVTNSTVKIYHDGIIRGVDIFE